MKSSIWILPKQIKDFYSLEIFAGFLKYNKNGLFSGPLRKESLESFHDDSIRFLITLDGAIQTNKNTFVFSIDAFKNLLRYMSDNRLPNIFCRCNDNKLHHVDNFLIDDKLQGIFDYEPKSRTVIFNPFFEHDEKNFVMGNNFQKPEVEIYLSNDDKNIKGIIVFKYEAGSVRNYGYELEVKSKLANIGGVVGKNRVLFSKRNFFTRTLGQLQNLSFRLFWGNYKKKIANYTVSSSISYGIDWFHIDGTIKSQFGEYKLSDVLKSSRGKNFVEIDNTIYFLPDSMKNLSSKASFENGEVNLSKNDLKQVNDFALSYDISPETYLKNFLNAETYKLDLRDIFRGNLKDYQTFGATWIFNLYKNNFGAYLADDMGLGKTIQTIAFICANGRDFQKPVLIVSPKTVLFNWQNEFRKFAPSQSILVAYGNKIPNELQTDDIVYLTTYETILSHQEIFSSIEFDTIIVDEAQYVKNLRTQRYKSLRMLKSHFRLALSGTPIENNLEELWTIFDFLNPGLLGTHSSFMSRYHNLNEDDHSLKKLRQIIMPFILRRTKDTVSLGLPPRQDNFVLCDMEEDQRQLYQNILSMAKKDLESLPSRYEIRDNSIILQALLYLRETCSEPSLLPPELQMPCSSCKFELFKDYSQKIMHGNSGKLIVYSLFPRVLHILQDWSCKNGWKTFFIDGTTTNRQSIIDEFERSSSGIFFISLKAGGVGINLVSCQYVIIYEPWWNLAVEEQAAARVYRVGQKKPVFVYHFLVQNTIEEKIRELQRLKNELSDNVMNDMKQPRKISMEDILKLLSDEW